MFRNWDLELKELRSIVEVSGEKASTTGRLEGPVRQISSLSSGLRFAKPVTPMCMCGGGGSPAPPS